MAFALKFLGLLAVVYAALVIFVWATQSRIAFPAPRSALPRFPGASQVSIATHDGLILRGLFFPPNGPTPAPAMIWFYGNAETAAGLASLVQYLRPGGVGVLLLDYRGYGASDGSPNEAGMYRDAHAALAWLQQREDVDSTKILAYGRSLGSSIAAHLAARERLAGVIFDSPFTNARALARLHYPWVPTFGLRLKLETLAEVAKLTCPVLVFHGTHDTIVPIALGRQVAKAAEAQELVEIQGAGHNDTYVVDIDAYRAKLATFVKRVTAP